MEDDSTWQGTRRLSTIPDRARLPRFEMRSLPAVVERTDLTMGRRGTARRGLSRRRLLRMYFNLELATPKRRICPSVDTQALADKPLAARLFLFGTLEMATRI